MTGTGYLFLFRIISTKWDCFIMFFQGVPSVYGRVFGWSFGFLQLPEVKNLQFLVVHFFSYPWCREVILGILGFTFGIYGPTLDQRKGLFSEVTGLLPTLLLQALGPKSHRLRTSISHRLLCLRLRKAVAPIGSLFWHDGISWGCHQLYFRLDHEDVSTT